MARKVFVLPTLMLGPADVNRTLLELQELEDFLRQVSARKTADVSLPKMSRTLESLADINGIDLLKAESRTQLLGFVQQIQERAPVLHFSFASEPSAAFTAHIVEWLRANVSKYALVQVGLQPSIAGGCIVRSTNKVFDLSLRRHFKDHAAVLPQLLADLRTKEPQPSIAELAVAAAGAKADKPVAAKAGGHAS